MLIRFKFSSALHNARNSLNMTQAQAAELLGISIRWYQKIESGTSNPNLELMCKLSKYFSLDLASFVKEETN